MGTPCPWATFTYQMTEIHLEVVRVDRIELTSLAWKAKVLPLNYTRKGETKGKRREMILSTPNPENCDVAVHRGSRLLE
jgi:hypothetical protein